jgi:hypothetical protein
MNNSFLRSAKLNEARGAGGQTDTPPHPSRSAHQTGSPTIYFNSNQNLIASRDAFVPLFIYTQTKWQTECLKAFPILEDKKERVYDNTTHSFRF